MSDQFPVSVEELETYYQHIYNDAESNGYYLNPDIGFTKELVLGLLINIKRYGYPNCPCRLATGNASADLDIVCPCDYRDADVTEYGTCY